MPDQTKPVLERETEVYAGFLEPTNCDVGRIAAKLSSRITRHG
jgi:hypothetical protein